MDRLDMPTLYLYPMDGDSIPEYFFDHDGVEYINNFEMNCGGPSLFEASPLAFEQNVSTSINRFSLIGCNFKNLAFLKGLAVEVGDLNQLNFLSSPNINETLTTLPDGFITPVLRITNSNLLGLNLFHYPQILYLQELRVADNVMIDDNTIDALLNWMLQTSNKNSLTKLYIYNNGLKRIPSGLSRLSTLTHFRFDGNILEFGIVQKGELKFSDYTILVMLSNCGIHTIEPGAFQGKI
jgi:Leucine-rich repeat (LRR) protein